VLAFCRPGFSISRRAIALSKSECNLNWKADSDLFKPASTGQEVGIPQGIGEVLKGDSSTSTANSMGCIGMAM